MHRPAIGVRDFKFLTRHRLAVLGGNVQRSFRGGHFDPIAEDSEGPPASGFSIGEGFLGRAKHCLAGGIARNALAISPATHREGIPNFSCSR